MINLTRIDNSEILVNADEIETIETAHHSTISLKSGKKIIVIESGEIIVGKIIEYKRRCFAELLLKLPDSI